MSNKVVPTVGETFQYLGETCGMFESAECHWGDPNTAELRHSELVVVLEVQGRAARVVTSSGATGWVGTGWFRTFFTRSVM